MCSSDLNDAPKTLISVVIDKLLAGEKPSLTAGEQIWDYLYSDDAADAFYRMALKGKDGAVYVLGSGQTKPLKEFMKIIRASINPTLRTCFFSVDIKVQVLSGSIALNIYWCIKVIYKFEILIVSCNGRIS